MSDIRLVWSALDLAADFAVESEDLVTDDGLETAILLSLFLDRRAEDSDVLPAGATDRRGWWADEFADVTGDKIGSRLWLIDRSKNTQDTLDKADEYTREALQWLINDKVVSSFDVDVSVPMTGVRGVRVTVYRPNVDPVTFDFSDVWEAQARRVG